HKKLRTRAEDYVHKPLAFGELLQHVQSFVTMDAPAADGESVIVIDDEIEVSNDEYVIEDDDGAETAIVKASELALGEAHPAAGEHGAPPPPPPRAVIPTAPSQVRASAAPPAAMRGMSLRPPAAPGGLDLVEQERMRDDLAEARERLATADRDLDESHREIEKLRIEVGEAERLAREVD
ncbi:MAG: hypothetical protein ACREJ3_13305, partial [Polyangiaceae bacterium]